jgi:hypothetical protein
MALSALVAHRGEGKRIPQTVDQGRRHRYPNVVKGRTRDTAWFSILDGEWPGLRAAYDRWLTPENFVADGRQRVSLASLTAPLLKSTRPEP